MGLPGGGSSLTTVLAVLIQMSECDGRIWLP